MFEGFFNLRLNQYFLKSKIKNNSKIFTKDKYWKDNVSFKDPMAKLEILSGKKEKLNDLKNEIAFIKSKFKNKKKRK